MEHNSVGLTEARRTLIGEQYLLGIITSGELQLFLWAEKQGYITLTPSENGIVELASTNSSGRETV